MFGKKQRSKPGINLGELYKIYNDDYVYGKVIIKQIPKEKFDIHYLLEDYSKYNTRGKNPYISKPQFEYYIFLEKIMEHVGFANLSFDKLVSLLNFDRLVFLVKNELENRFDSLSFNEVYSLVFNAEFCVQMLAFDIIRKRFVSQISKSQIVDLINFENEQVSQFGFEVLELTHKDKKSFMKEIYELIVQKKISLRYISCLENGYFKYLSFDELFVLLSLDNVRDSFLEFIKKTLKCNHNSHLSDVFLGKQLSSKNENIKKFSMELLGDKSFTNLSLIDIKSYSNSKFEDVVAFGYELLQKRLPKELKIKDYLKLLEKDITILEPQKAFENISFGDFTDAQKQELKRKYPEVYYIKEGSKLATTLKQIGCWCTNKRQVKTCLYFLFYNPSLVINFKISLWIFSKLCACHKSFWWVQNLCSQLNDFHFVNSTKFIQP